MMGTITQIEREFRAAVARLKDQPTLTRGQYNVLLRKLEAERFTKLEVHWKSREPVTTAK